MFFKKKILKKIYFFFFRNNARFLWKRIPKEIKLKNKELEEIWEIGKNLWNKNYSNIYVCINSFNWSPEIKPLIEIFLGK